MITTAAMRTLEQNCGIPKLTLMERAGMKAFQIIKDQAQGKRALVVCYHGNNGGDGLVVAQHLSAIAEVDVLFIGDEDRLHAEVKMQYAKAIKNTQFQFFENYTIIDFEAYDIIIDALLGSGITGEVRNELKTVIEKINESLAYTVSLDVPSGINGDTGEGYHVNADLVITFHDTKPGLTKFTVQVADVGIPKISKQTK